MKKSTILSAIFLTILFVQSSFASTQTEVRGQQIHKNTPLLIIDGKVDNKTKIEDINPEKIESMNVLKGEHAEKKYGKGVQSAIEIKMKSINKNQ